MNIRKGSTTSRVISIVGTILAVTLILANINSIYGLLSTVCPIGSTGVVASANLGVFQESQCINNVTSINWGTLSAGGTNSVTVYVKNIGTVPLTLSLSTGSWSPAGAQSYMTVTWNYAGATIQPNGVQAVTITLTVSASIQGITNFSFNVIITGTQV